MNYMLCRNRVRNFDYWKGVFDSHADAHRAAGLKLVHLWYEVSSPRNVFFLFEVEDNERARAFLESSETAASSRESGLIEGDFRFFSESLGYGGLDDEQTRAFAEATRVVATKDANDLAAAAPEKSTVPSEPVNSAPPEVNAEPEKKAEPEQTAEPEKNTEPEKTAEPEEKATPSESVTTPEPEKRPMPSPAMKGPERVKTAQPVEPFEGYAPVENWPPAEAAADTTPERAPEKSRPRGRWVRLKY